MAKGDKLYNALSLFAEGTPADPLLQQQLPNYGVFDEKRYFHAGNDTCVVELKGYRLGLLICEDLWFLSRSTPPRPPARKYLVDQRLAV